MFTGYFLIFIIVIGSVVANVLLYTKLAKCKKENEELNITLKVLQKKDK